MPEPLSGCTLGKLRAELDRIAAELDEPPQPGTAMAIVYRRIYDLVVAAAQVQVEVARRYADLLADGQVLPAEPPPPAAPAAPPVAEQMRRTASLANGLAVMSVAGSVAALFTGYGVFAAGLFTAGLGCFWVASRRRCRAAQIEFEATCPDHGSRHATGPGESQ